MTLKQVFCFFFGEGNEAFQLLKQYYTFLWKESETPDCLVGLPVPTFFRTLETVELWDFYLNAVVAGRVGGVGVGQGIESAVAHDVGLSWTVGPNSLYKIGTPE